MPPLRRIITSVVALALSAATGCTGEAPEVSVGPTPKGSSGVDAGRVDVGGYELAYGCRGSGSPTIVTEAGYDASGLDAYAGLIGPLSETSRVCAYDRAGIGLSDRRTDPEGLTSRDQAQELHRLLERAGIEPPYVLVAHSYGGFVSRLFAASYPAETAGLVLIESSHEDEIEAYRDVYGEDSPDADWVDGGDLLDIDATGLALRGDAHDLGRLPLIVIRAERYEDVLSERLWRRTQADLATISRDGLLVVSVGSGHFVIDQDPVTVIAAVAGVIEAARSGSQLPRCDEVFRSVPAADCLD